jgi:hypothetical protein
VSRDISLIYEKRRSEGKITMEERGVAEWKGAFITMARGASSGACEEGDERRSGKMGETSQGSSYFREDFP